MKAAENEWRGSETLDVALRIRVKPLRIREDLGPLTVIAGANSPRSVTATVHNLPLRAWERSIGSASRDPGFESRFWQDTLHPVLLTVRVVGSEGNPSDQIGIKQNKNKLTNKTSEVSCATGVCMSKVSR